MIQVIMRKAIFILLSCLITPFLSSAQSKKLKVACLGNSVTYGYSIEDRQINVYPSHLQALLGDDYGLPASTFNTEFNSK
jgi:sialate O-acetylesterase